MERKQAKQEAASLGAMDRCAFATRWETPFRLGKLLQIYARERIWVLFQPNVFGFVNLHVLTRVDHPVLFCTSVVFFANTVAMTSSCKEVMQMFHLELREQMLLSRAQEFLLGNLPPAPGQAGSISIAITPLRES